MIHSINRNLEGQADLRLSARQPRPSANSFRDQLLGASPSSGRPSGGSDSGRGTPTVPPSSDVITLTVPRRNLVAANVASAAAPAAPAAPAASGATSSAANAASAGEETLKALNALSEALRSAGINPESLGMVAHDEIATYPGGNYLNRFITLKAGNHTETFMANLVSLDPRVAVTEIKNLLKLA